MPVKSNYRLLGNIFAEQSVSSVFGLAERGLSGKRALKETKAKTVCFKRWMNQGSRQGQVQKAGKREELWITDLLLTLKTSQNKNIVLEMSMKGNWMSLSPILTHLFPSSVLVAYCKNSIDGQWYCFDDSEVTPVADDDVCQQTAYILFYQRRTAIPSWSANSSVAGQYLTGTACDLQSVYSVWA